NGQKFNKNEFDNKIKDQIVFIDDDSEKVLAIYMVHPSKESEIKPKKVFN
ncbi:tRNA pseudouridine(55) synthase TruB, partial [Staphylococcus aureus]|nr:tRNA pseudouridine(55) synthase TruB [Staphylococcus aureus]